MTSQEKAINLGYLFLTYNRKKKKNHQYIHLFLLIVLVCFNFFIKVFLTPIHVPQMSPNNGFRWWPLGKLSHLRLEQLYWPKTQVSGWAYAVLRYQVQYCWLRIFVISFAYVTLLPLSTSRATVTDVAPPSSYVKRLAAAKEAWSSNVTTECVTNSFTSPYGNSPQHQCAPNP